MDKPCRDCYQTKNIYGHPFHPSLGLLGEQDHVGTYTHPTCPPELCSGHVPINDSFHAFVLETLECEKR